MDEVVINKSVTLPESLLMFTYSRSSGPGGQNVNKLNTRVGVGLDVVGCPCLTESQKIRILHALRGRIDKQGVLHVVCQEYRSQHANRNAAVERLANLLQEALHVATARKTTRVPRSAVEKRLRQKKHRSLQKRLRMENSGLE